MTKRIARPSFAMAGALALTLGGAIPGTLPDASAVVIVSPPSPEPTEPPAIEAPTSLIDSTKTGTLNIHKYLSDKATEAGTGNEQAPIPGTPMNGIPFQIQKVEADLTTDAGWAAAAALTPETAVPVGTPKQETTSGGVATFTELPLGVYLVKELSPTPGDTTPNPGADALVPAAPFLVFIPMTNPDDTSQWNYNIHVYPKNSEIGITKAVSDAGKHVGDKLTWTITADIPVPTYTRETETNSGTGEGEGEGEGEGTGEGEGEGEGGGEGEGSGATEPSTTTTDTVDQLTSYVITDPVPNNRVKVDAKDVKVSAPKVGLLTANDYIVAVDPTTSEVTVTFNDSGLQKLADARHEAAERGEVGDDAPQVIVTIAAEILEVGATDGVALNTATLTTNVGHGDIKVLSNEVVTRHRTVQINKFDKENPETKLVGAEFELYVCDVDKNLLEKVEVGTPDTAGKRTSSWTTGADGTAVIDGLHVTNFADNAAVDDGAQMEYCLVETKAPEGYELLTQAISFALPGPEPEGEVTAAKVDVPNIKSVSPNLPLTGGPGIIALVLAGLALIGGGAWYGLRSSRRS